MSQCYQFVSRKVKMHTKREKYMRVCANCGALPHTNIKMPLGTNSHGLNYTYLNRSFLKLVELSPNMTKDKMMRELVRLAATL